MHLRHRPVLSGLAVLAASASLVACGKDDPLGKQAAKDSPAPVSNETTTAELAKIAVDDAMPSVVAVSVTRGGSTKTGTGTVLAKHLVVTDATLVRPTATGSSASTTTGAASAGSGATTASAPRTSPTPAATTPSGTTPSRAEGAALIGDAPQAERIASTSPASTPRATPGATASATPQGTSPASPTATPRPTSTPRPLPKVPNPPTVTVREASGEEHAATVEGVDPISGLAVLRVSDLGDTVPVAMAGAAPKLGQEVASVGYLAARRPAVRPGAIVTTGRTSRRNRESEVGLIEATAPLGVQGIGGPLVDGKGQVVALTTRAIQSAVPGTVVAVPYTSALRIAKALMDEGRVRRAYLGLDTVGITPTRAEELRLDTATGVLIQSIVPGSPASFSTLRGPDGRTWIAGRLIPTGSDAITAIDGKPVREPEDLDAALALKAPGDKVALTVVRGDQGLTVHVTLGER